MDGWTIRQQLDHYPCNLEGYRQFRASTIDGSVSCVPLPTNIRLRL